MTDRSPIDIYRRPSGQRIWLVRAEGGTYLPNFRKSGVIALGHLDELEIDHPPDKVFSPTSDEIYKGMEKAYIGGDEDRRRSLTSHFNQTIRFISEINVGDLVLTPDEPHYNRLQIGRVIGLPRFDNSPVDITRDIASGRTTRMTHGLRRKVAWGPQISKDSLPNVLQKALRAQQSVSNLDDHWESIYHSVYPAFMDGDVFHFSINIGTERRVDNYTITQLLSFLTDAEVASRFTDDIDDGNLENFDQLVTDIAYSENLNLNTKARFMSPGEVWGALSSLGTEWLQFYFIYSAIFGSKLVGWDGVIDLKTKQKLFKFIEKRWKNKSGDLIKNRLNTSIPKRDTKALEDNSGDEKDAA